MYSFGDAGRLDERGRSRPRCRSRCAMIRASISRTLVRYSSSFRLSLAPRRPCRRVGVFHHVVENALLILLPLGASGGRTDLRRAREQPLENEPRVGLGRNRRALGLPGDVRGIRAAITGVALARLAALVAAQLERGEARGRADLLRGELIDRDADLDIGAAGLLGLAAGEERGHRTGMVARTVAVGLGLFLRQAGEDEHVLLERLEQLERRCQLVVLADLRGRPILHVDAVRYVTERQSQRRGCGFGDGVGRDSAKTLRIGPMRRAPAARPPRRRHATSFAARLASYAWWNSFVFRAFPRPRLNISAFVYTCTSGLRIWGYWRVTPRFFWKASLLDDLQHQAREPIVFLGNGLQRSARPCLVVIFQPAAEGVRQQSSTRQRTNKSRLALEDLFSVRRGR